MITNSDDTIDVRQLNARIDDLRSDLDDLEEVVGDATDALKEHVMADRIGTQADWEKRTSELTGNLALARIDLIEWQKSDDGLELEQLNKLAKQLDGEGVDLLIHEDHFQDYAREYAQDSGAMTVGDKWPYTCIDWEKVAEELRADYTAFEWDEVTYYGR